MWRWHLESILIQKSHRNAKIFTLTGIKGTWDFPALCLVDVVCKMSFIIITK